MFSFVYSNLIWKRRICILQHHVAVAALQASTRSEKKTEAEGSKQTGTHTDINTLLCGTARTAIHKTEFSFTLTKKS